MKRRFLARESYPFANVLHAFPTRSARDKWVAVSPNPETFLGWRRPLSGNIARKWLRAWERDGLELELHEESRD